MGYINIYISTPCNILIKNKQLVVRGIEEHKYPLEDINSLLIETHECTITSYALQAFADSGVCVFTCNASHMPNGVLVPYNAYYRPLKVLGLQLGATKPLIKQLWQTIVRQKIENQAASVALATQKDVADLLQLVKTVYSNDSTNNEAIAANLYFKKLFGKSFVRRDDGFINSCLNYGYALMRGIIARTLVSYGFEPSIGIHHCNELNNFNLADDLIEPFRPIVDLFVFSLNDCEVLTPKVKRILFGIISQDVEINGQLHNLSYAVELVVQSYKKSLEDNANNLVLPKVLPINMHRYE